MQTRRTFLNSTLLLAGTAVAEGRNGIALAAAEGGIDPGMLSAKLTLPDGSVKTFAGARGVDLGDFVVPFARIVQRNVLTKDASGLFSVFFRPDRNSNRLEVVTLYGDPQNDSPHTHGPYTFEIFVGERSVQKTEVPYHFWLARWRWQSSPRPRVRKPSELIAAKLSPPYGITEIAATKLPNPAKPYTVMGISSITPFIGQTGERGDIGINPECHSAYMATEDATAYQSMMDWAEASGTGPWHINDPATGGVFSFAANPDATIISNGTKPLHVQRASERDASGKFIYPTFIQPDDAHHPCTSYIPFITTGDPYHAEELQYQINFYLGGESQPRGKPKTFIFDQAQTRGYGWMMRSVLFNILAADLIQSPTLLPKGYWKRILDNNLAWITANFVDAKDNKEFWFSSGTSKTAMGWWQENYLCGVIATAVQLGFREWLPVLKWKIQTDINRLNGKSGWNPGWPTLYFAQYVKQSQRPGEHNAGNGALQFDQLSARASQYSYVGEWQIRFKSSTEFDIVTPSGAPPAGPVKSGIVGKRTGSGYVPMFTVNAGSEPFAAGDVIYWTISKITNWKDLWDTNLAMGVVKDAGPGELPQAATDYMYGLYATVALAAPNVPEIAALLPDFVAKMKAGGAKLSWRDSFVLLKP